MKIDDTDLYPVITPELCKLPPLLVLEAVLKGGAKAVQLREKNDPLKYARAFRDLTDKYGALLIINDFIDVALACGADGVHIGQEDGDVAGLREKAPGLILGVSAEDLDQALLAQNAGADYIGYGPIFPTETKKDIKDIKGIEGIKGIAGSLNIPLVAIGGINKGNIKDVARAGTKHIAMITAITQTDDPEKETQELIDLIRLTH